jgi:hypothetical protein
MAVKRLVVFAMLAAGVALVVQRITNQSDPAVREGMTAMCHRMMATMPESFPPNRMLADLAAIKEQNVRILEILEDHSDLESPNE